MTENESLDKYLPWMSIAHYVIAVITALTACLAIFHVVIGLQLITGRLPVPHESGSPDFPFPFSVLPWFFVIFGVLFIGLGWIFAVLQAIAGRFLAQRKNRMFCIVIAGIECLHMPFGTATGVITLLLLFKPEVIAAFENQR